MNESPAIVQHSYDLLLYLVPQLAKFPRSQKFVLADRIQNALTNVLEALVRAYYLPRGETKRAAPTCAMWTTSWCSAIPKKNFGQ